MSLTCTSRAGSPRPGFQPHVEPILLMCTFVDPDDAVALPAAPPRWAGNSPTPLAASKHRQRLFPNGFPVLIATPGWMEPAWGMPVSVTPQGHPSADRCLPAHRKHQSRERHCSAPGEPPRPRSHHRLTAGILCSQQHRGLCHWDRGFAGSERQGRLWPQCSCGRDGGARPSPLSQPPPTAHSC